MTAAAIVLVALLAGCGVDTSADDTTAVATPMATDATATTTPTGSDGPDAGRSPDGEAPTAPSADDTDVRASEGVRCDNGVFGISVWIPDGWEAADGAPQLHCRLLGPVPLATDVEEEPLFAGYAIHVSRSDASEDVAELVDSFRSGTWGAYGPPPVVAEAAASVAGRPATRMVVEGGDVWYVIDVPGPVVVGATAAAAEAVDEVVDRIVIRELPPSLPTTDCRGGWMTPDPGTSLRTAPLDALRAHHGLRGLFVVDEMRYFETPRDPASVPRGDHLRYWYVKAAQEDDPAFRARWLLVAAPEGAPTIVATATASSQGFGPGAWIAFSGESDSPSAHPGLPGAYSGTAYDYVTGLVLETGEPSDGPSGLPDEVVGCMRGT